MSKKERELPKSMVIDTSDRAAWFREVLAEMDNLPELPADVDPSEWVDEIQDVASVAQTALEERAPGARRHVIRVAAVAMLIVEKLDLMRLHDKVRRRDKRSDGERESGHET